MSEPNQDPALARIEDALRHMGQEHAPAPDWQARVLAATADANVSARPTARGSGTFDFTARRSSRLRLVLVPAFAAAAAIALFVWAQQKPEPTAVAELALAVDVEHKATVRGEDAHKGDVLHVRASGGRHRAVWIYRENVRVLGCPGDAACTADGAAYTIPSLGNYEIVALAADAPLPASVGDYDSDLAAVKAAGIRYRTETVSVK
jgi:hypothetical protein